MPSERFAPWLAVARRYFEHRADCERCEQHGARACPEATALRIEADAALVTALEARAPSASRPMEAAS